MKHNIKPQKRNIIEPVEAIFADDPRRREKIKKDLTRLFQLEDKKKVTSLSPKEIDELEKLQENRKYQSLKRIQDNINSLIAKWPLEKLTFPDDLPAKVTALILIRGLFKAPENLPQEEFDWLYYISELNKIFFSVIFYINGYAKQKYSFEYLPYIFHQIQNLYLAYIKTLVSEEISLYMSESSNKEIQLENVYYSFMPKLFHKISLNKGPIDFLSLTHLISQQHSEITRKFIDKNNLIIKEHLLNEMTPNHAEHKAGQNAYPFIADQLKMFSVFAFGTDNRYAPFVSYNELEGAYQALLGFVIKNQPIETWVAVNKTFSLAQIVFSCFPHLFPVFYQNTISEYLKNYSASLTFSNLKNSSLILSSQNVVEKLLMEKKYENDSHLNTLCRILNESESQRKIDLSEFFSSIYLYLIKDDKAFQKVFWFYGDSSGHEWKKIDRDHLVINFYNEFIDELEKNHNNIKDENLFDVLTRLIAFRPDSIELVDALIKIISRRTFKDRKIIELVFSNLREMNVTYHTLYEGMLWFYGDSSVDFWKEIDQEKLITDYDDQLLDDLSDNHNYIESKNLIDILVNLIRYSKKRDELFKTLSNIIPFRLPENKEFIEAIFLTLWKKDVPYDPLYESLIWLYCNSSCHLLEKIEPEGLIKNNSDVLLDNLSNNHNLIESENLINIIMGLIRFEKNQDKLIKILADIIPLKLAKDNKFIETIFSNLWENRVSYHTLYEAMIWFYCDSTYHFWRSVNREDLTKNYSSQLMNHVAKNYSIIKNENLFDFFSYLIKFSPHLNAQIDEIFLYVPEDKILEFLENAKDKLSNEIIGLRLMETAGRTLRRLSKMKDVKKIFYFLFAGKKYDGLQKDGLINVFNNMLTLKKAYHELVTEDNLFMLRVLLDTFKKLKNLQLIDLLAHKKIANFIWKKDVQLINLFSEYGLIKENFTLFNLDYRISGGIVLVKNDHGEFPLAPQVADLSPLLKYPRDMLEQDEQEEIIRWDRLHRRGFTVGYTVSAVILISLIIHLVYSFNKHEDSNDETIFFPSLGLIAPCIWAACGLLPLCSSKLPLGLVTGPQRAAGNIYSYFANMHLSQSSEEALTTVTVEGDKDEPILLSTETDESKTAVEVIIDNKENESYEMTTAQPYWLKENQSKEQDVLEENEQDSSEDETEEIPLIKKSLIHHQ